MSASAPLPAQAFIFDMDGTLVDNIAYHQQAWLRFLAGYGQQLTAATFAAHNHGTADEMMRRFFGADLPLATIKRLGYEKEALYRDLYRPALRELPGLTTLLHQARQRGIRLALATMGDADNIALVLDGLGIRPYFDLVLGGHQVTYGKPHPEIYLAALAQLGLPPAQVLAFEDSAGGVRSAQAAGLRVVGVCTAHTPAEFAALGVAEAIYTFADYSATHFTNPRPDYTVANP